MVLRNKGRTERVCYYCRKPGHFIRECRLLQQKKEEEEDRGRKIVRKAKTAVESPICFTVGNNRCSGSWYVDSGCSSHMTNDESFFRKLDRSVKTDVVLADGSVSKSAGIGEGIVKCVDGDGRERDIAFKDVLLVPNLDCNLLSVRKMTQKGLSVNFRASKCTVVSPDGDEVAVADLSGELYRLNVAKDARLSEENRRSDSCRFVNQRIQEEQAEEREVPVQEEYPESAEEFYDCVDC